MLVVFGGLPGVGKSAIAELVVRQRPATFLRLDAIEQALREALALPEDLHDAGYRVAYALAEANLTVGATVVADCVNPIALTRESWREAAERAGAALLQVEVICSDSREHQRRVESRSAGVPGLRLPTWDEVLARPFEPWPTADIVIDSSKLSAGEAAAVVMTSMIEKRSPR